MNVMNITYNQEIMILCLFPVNGVDPKKMSCAKIIVCNAHLVCSSDESANPGETS